MASMDINYRFLPSSILDLRAIFVRISANNVFNSSPVLHSSETPNKPLAQRISWGNTVKFYFCFLLRLTFHSWAEHYRWWFLEFLGFSQAFWLSGSLRHFTVPWPRPWSKRRSGTRTTRFIVADDTSPQRNKRTLKCQLKRMKQLQTTVNMLQYELHLPKRHVTALFKRKTNSVFLFSVGFVVNNS